MTAWIESTLLMSPRRGSCGTCRLGMCTGVLCCNENDQAVSNAGHYLSPYYYCPYYYCPYHWDAGTIVGLFAELLLRLVVSVVWKVFVFVDNVTLNGRKEKCRFEEASKRGSERPVRGPRGVQEGPLKVMFFKKEKERDI